MMIDLSTKSHFVYESSMTQAAHGSVAIQFFWFGFQLVQYWFGVNRLALENGLVQFGLPMRMI